MSKCAKCERESDVYIDVERNPRLPSMIPEYWCLSCVHIYGQMNSIGKEYKDKDYME